LLLTSRLLIPNSVSVVVGGRLNVKVSIQMFTPQFVYVTKKAAIIGKPSGKYGGPVVEAFNNHGQYDLVAFQHNFTPKNLFWGQDTPINTAYMQKMIGGDLHRMAAGDYDNDTFG
tara:strand:+ start:2692 stop:3036 length:345 start_codon:yes stop_codon:yes gene_type:complete